MGNKTSNSLQPMQALHENAMFVLPRDHHLDNDASSVIANPGDMNGYDSADQERDKISTIQSLKNRDDARRNSIVSNSNPHMKEASSSQSSLDKGIGVTTKSINSDTNSSNYSDSKYDGLEEVDQKKLTAFVVLDEKGKVVDSVAHHLGGPAVFKKKFSKAIGMSTYFNPDNANFKLDGPDDTAYLVKEPIEGIGQSLAHMGVLWLFTPFVAMAKRGLKAEFKKTVAEMKDMRGKIDADLRELKQLKPALSDKLPNINFTHKTTLEQARKNIAELTWHIDHARDVENDGSDHISNIKADLDSLQERYDEKKNEVDRLSSNILNGRNKAAVEHDLQKNLTRQEKLELWIEMFKGTFIEFAHNGEFTKNSKELNDLKFLEVDLKKQINSFDNKDNVLEEIENLHNEILAKKNQLSYLTKTTDLNSYLSVANKFVNHITEFNELKWKRPEAFASYLGMSGMLKAMVLFFIGASGSAIPHLSDSAAAHWIGEAGRVIGEIGTGVMAFAQLAMFLSGVNKVCKGFKDVQDLRIKLKTINIELKKLEEMQFNDFDKEIYKPKIQALKGMRDNLPREIKWRFLEKAVPGTSLSIGQGLMFAWSMISVVGILSGVGAPAGFGLMVPLLALGVGFTLASALPKFGFETIFEDQVGKRFGMHEEDEGFYKLEYRSELRTSGIKNALDLAKHTNQKVELLSLIEKDKPLDHVAEGEIIGNNEAKLFNILTNNKADINFEDLYSLLKANNVLESFVENIANIKAVNKAGVFEENTVIDVKKINNLSLMHIFEPWQLRKTVLNLYNIRKEQNKIYENEKVDLEKLLIEKAEAFNDGVLHDNQKKPTNISDMRITYKKLNVLDESKFFEEVKKSHKNQVMVDKVKDAAIEILKEFAVKRLRAEIDATTDSLMYALSAERLFSTTDRAAPLEVSA